MELTSLTAEPRAVCAQCRRPVVVCYCAHIVPVATRTKLVLVQHRRERDVPIGTLRMAELALPSASVFIGVNELDADQGLREGNWIGGEARDVDCGHEGSSD